MKKTWYGIIAAAALWTGTDALAADTAVPAQPSQTTTVRLIPVNPAESLLGAFWDPSISDFANWKAAGGNAVQSWAGGDIYWKSGTMTLTRDLDLDCTAFDRLLAAVVPTPGTTFELTAQTDVGLLRKTFVIPPKNSITEFALDLNGAKKITRITMAFTAASASNGFCKWIGLQNTANLKIWEKYWQQMRQMDLSPYLNNNPSTTFNPTFQLICTKAELDAVRARVTKQPEERQSFTNWRDKISQQPEALSRLREYATADPRFVRDREINTPALYNSSEAAWVGAVMRDPVMMKMAARRAITLVLSPKWGAGMFSSIPGTAWEHRCFDEAMSVVDLITTLDLAGEYFSPLGRDLIMRSVAERGLGTINFNAWKYDYIYDCNQLAAFSPARILGYGVMEKLNWKHATPYTDLAMQELNECMRRNLHPDGGYFEGADYYQYTMANAMPAYYFYARLRNKSFKDILPQELQKSPDFAELMISTDEKQLFMPINDGRHGMNIDAISFLSAMFPDSQYVRIYHRYLKNRPLPAGSRWPWIVGSSIPQNDPPYRNFIQIPSMASASSVRRIDQALVKVALVGDAAGMTHKHYDAGSFIIEADGETLAMDSSGCFYNVPIHKVLMQSDRHNVMIPRDAVTAQKRLKTPLTLQASGNDQSFHAELDLMPCWSEWFNQRRRIIDSPNPQTIIIKDIFELKKGEVTDFFWLTQQKISVEGRTVTITGTRSVARFTVPEGWEIKTETLSRDILTPQQRLILSTKMKKGELVLPVTLTLLPATQAK